MIILMILHEIGRSAPSPRVQRRFFKDDNHGKYWSPAWKDLRGDADNTFAKFMRRSWDPSWRIGVKMYPWQKVDFISLQNRCDMCDRAYKRSTTYRLVTIYGEGYDPETMVSWICHPKTLTANNRSQSQGQTAEESFTWVGFGIA